MYNSPYSKGTSSSYLRAKLYQHHVLVWSGISDDFHVLDHFVEGGHKLHEVVAGHGSRDGEDAQHGAAPHVLLQRGHLAEETTVTQPQLTSERAKAQLDTFPTTYPDNSVLNLILLFICI